MNKSIDLIVDEFNKKYFKLSPVTASSLGLAEFDGLMPDESPEGVEELKFLFEDTKRELLNIAPDSLSFDDKIDLEAFASFLNSEIFSLAELPYLKSRPESPATVSSALYFIFSREETPLEERFRSMEQRLLRVPSYLKSSQKLIESPVDIWVADAIVAAGSFLPFISLIKESAAANNLLTPSFNRSCELALNAMDDYRKWLQNEVMPAAKTDFCIGKDKFEHILRSKKIPYNSDELVKLGLFYLEDARKRASEVAAKIRTGASFEEIKEETRNNYPADIDKILDFCRKANEKARNYVIDSKFADIPDGDILEVKETPEMLRHFIPLAAYMRPLPFSKRQKGTYVVTRPSTGEAFKDFNYTALFNKSLHEGYPGHHLHFVCANRHPSKARLFTGSPEAIEGWAHYCEDYAAVNGFPEDLFLHFTMNLELIWKACRIIIDVKLACGEMTVHEGVEMLMREASFTRPIASSEVNRYTYTPTYQLSYLTGKHIIMELKKELYASYKESFTDRDFHNLFLSSGMIPLYLFADSARYHFSRGKVPV